MEHLNLDESHAPEYVGKSILIGVTYLDYEEKLIGRKQWFATILTYSAVEGIMVKLKGSEEITTRLPYPDEVRKANPGSYTLNSTGEEVINPDYFSSWTLVAPEGERADIDSFLPIGIDTSSNKLK